MADWCGWRKFLIILAASCGYLWGRTENSEWERPWRASPRRRRRWPCGLDIDSPGPWPPGSSTRLLPSDPSEQDNKEDMGEAETGRPPRANEATCKNKTISSLCYLVMLCSRLSQSCRLVQAGMKRATQQLGYLFHSAKLWMRECSDLMGIFVPGYSRDWVGQSRRLHYIRCDDAAHFTFSTFYNLKLFSTLHIDHQVLFSQPSSFPIPSIWRHLLH